MFIEGAAIAVVYFIVKFLEMRFISGETLPMRVIIRDTSFVYLASIIGLYTLKQFKQSDMIKTVGGGEDKPAAAAFTSNPDFWWITLHLVKSTKSIQIHKINPNPQNQENKNNFIFILFLSFLTFFYILCLFYLISYFLNFFFFRHNINYNQLLKWEEA